MIEIPYSYYMIFIFLYPKVLFFVGLIR